MSSAGLRGGLDPDLLDEVAYWNDDHWRHALYAAIVLIRVGAPKADDSIAGLAGRVADLHGVDLGGPVSDGDTPG